MGVEAIIYTLDLTCDCCGKDIQVEGGGGVFHNLENVIDADIEGQGWSWKSGKLHCNEC